MAKGLFDDVPMLNKERDQAWEKFIKRKDVKAMMKSKEDFKFPMDGSYELWCIAWEFAWDAGWRKRMEVEVKNGSPKKGKKVR